VQYPDILKDNLPVRLLRMSSSLSGADHEPMNRLRQQHLFEIAGRLLMRGAVVLTAAFVMLRFGRFLLARPTLISDDEGYMLLTLKHYFAGEQLYTQVFTQYGPFYFLTQKAIFGLLHLPASYDAGRLVFYGYWVLASLLGGLFIYRVSKDVTLASAAALAVMWLERAMAFEPNHPDQMVIVLLMAGCVVAAKPNRMSLLFLGAIGAAAFFTKINVGILFLSAALIASVALLPAGRLRNISYSLLVGMTAVGPIVLMHRFLSGWAWGFCLLGIIAGVSVVLAAMRAKLDLSNQISALRFIALGALAMAIMIVIAAEGEGLSFRTLVNVVVVSPLHHPEVFFSCICSKEEDGSRGGSASCVRSQTVLDAGARASRWLDRCPEVCGGHTGGCAAGET
jgi:hypothetical protein